MTTTHHMLPLALTTMLAAAIAGTGCEGNASSAAVTGDAKAGNMSDTSYFTGRQKAARVSATGHEVTMQSFDGQFLWADYAAPWCGPCKGQAQAIRELEGTFGDEVAFLTVMTSEMGGYGHPATQATARKWASAHRLDPDHVVAATDLSAITVPRHILYSPQGHMLFLHTGTMTADQIRAVIAKRTEDWKSWSRSGELADWMRME